MSHRSYSQRPGLRFRDVLLCGLLPWRAPRVFDDYRSLERPSDRLRVILTSLLLYFGVGYTRNGGAGVESDLLLLGAMGLIAVAAMLFSYPATLVVTAISIVSDAMFGAIQMFVPGLPSWINGTWEATAVVIASVAVWRWKRSEGRRLGREMTDGNVLEA